MTELEVRALARRIDLYERQRREVLGGMRYVDEDERPRRLRLLAAWIRADRTKLRRLLAAVNRDQAVPLTEGET